RGISNRAPARGSGRHGARGRGPDPGLSSRHRQITDLQGEGAPARTVARLHQGMSNHSPDSDDALGARLRTELRRYAVPPYLRGSIAEAAEPPRAPRRGWLAPSLAAAAMALVLLLVSIPFLPRILPADPTERLVRSVVAEHTRALMWGARRQEAVPSALPWLTQESGIALKKFFGGDDRLAFVGAQPVFLQGRRGVALYYRDGDGHLVTYTALPAPGLPLPQSRRGAIRTRLL